MIRVVLASSEHPVDDKRLFSKIAVPLARAGNRVHVVGREAKLLADHRLEETTRSELKHAARWRRAVAAVAEVHRWSPDIVWIADLDVLALILVQHAFTRNVTSKPVVVCDIHEHFVSRVHDRLSQRGVRPSVSLPLACAFDLVFRLMLRRSDVVVAASVGLSRDLARRGILTKVIENGVTDTDLEILWAEPSRDPTVAAIERLARSNRVVVHPGAIDFRLDGEAIASAVAASKEPLAFVAIGGARQEVVRNGNTYLVLPAVPREVLLWCVALADAAFVGFRMSRYNELLASSHKLHEALGVAGQVVIPSVRQWLDAAAGSSIPTLVYAPDSVDSLAAAFAQVRKLPRRSVAGTQSIDGSLLTVIESAATLGRLGSAETRMIQSGKRLALLPSSRRRSLGRLQSWFRRSARRRCSG